MSVGLLIYWFRYSCLLILNAKTAKDYSSIVARSNRLAFVDVYSALESVESQAGAGPELDTLHKALEQDYRTLSNLTHFGLLFSAASSMETFLMYVDYHVMRAWFAAAKLVWPRGARRAVGEMVEIIRYFANCQGQKSQYSRA